MSKQIIDTLDTVLHESTNFTIHPCQYQAEEGGDLLDGYTVVYKKDGVIQGRGPAYAQTLAQVYSWEQTLQYVKAYEAAANLPLDNEGILTTELPGDSDLLN